MARADGSHGAAAGETVSAAPAPDTEPREGCGPDMGLASKLHDRFCKCSGKGPGWFSTFAAKYPAFAKKWLDHAAALRLTGDAAPTEPSDAAIDAAARCLNITWDDLDPDGRIALQQALRAAYAVDGVRAAPTEYRERGKP